VSRKTAEQKRARAMQENTGWPYMKCLNEVRKQIAEERSKKEEEQSEPKE